MENCISQRYWGAVFDKKRVCLERHSFTPSHLIPNGFYFPPFLLSHQKNSSSSISKQHKRELLKVQMKLLGFKLNHERCQLICHLDSLSFIATVDIFGWENFRLPYLPSINANMKWILSSQRDTKVFSPVPINPNFCDQKQHLEMIVPLVFVSIMYKSSLKPWL